MNSVFHSLFMFIRKNYHKYSLLSYDTPSVFLHLCSIKKGKLIF
jgi:hypothetical protein